MNSSDFFTVERTNGVLVIALGQSLSTFTEPLQQRRILIDEIRNSAAGGVLIDFGKVEYFDSLLLDTLCQAWKFLRERGAKMALCNVGKVAEEIVRKCRLDSLWPIYPSRQSALEALGPETETRE